MIVEFPDPDCLGAQEGDDLGAGAAFFLLFGRPTAKYRELEKGRSRSAPARLKGGWPIKM